MTGTAILGDKKISTFAAAEERLAETLPGYESRPVVRQTTIASSTDAVRQYRKAATAERGIRYRLDRGQAGTTRATEYALTHHAAIKAEVVEYLIAAGLRGWVGLLVEEESLAERIRTAETPRPELAGRLTDLRRKIRRWNV